MTNTIKIIFFRGNHPHGCKTANIESIVRFLKEKIKKKDVNLFEFRF